MAARSVFLVLGPPNAGFQMLPVRFNVVDFLKKSLPAIPRRHRWLVDHRIRTQVSFVLISALHAQIQTSDLLAIVL